MPTPIAELYSTQRLSTHSTPASQLSVSFASSSSTSAHGHGQGGGTSASGSRAAHSRSTHRTSVSLVPDDPFAGPLSDGTASRKGSEEGWARISEERPSGEDSNGVARGTNGTSSDKQAQEPPRRPSFFKSLLARRGGQPRRARSSSALSTAAISPLILSSSAPPPRVGPVRNRASLISLGEVAGSNGHGSSGAEEGASYPSGSSSMKFLPTPPSSTPLKDLFPSTSSSPISPSRTQSQTHSRTNSVRIAAVPPQPGSLRRPASAMELLPPTESSKAFAVLGGPRVTERNRKAVELLNGVRTSVYNAFSPSSAAPPPSPHHFDADEDNTITNLGLALTTDAPTRRIVPDNARYSLASVRSEATTTTLDISVGDRNSRAWSAASGGEGRETMYEVGRPAGGRKKEDDLAPVLPHSPPLSPPPSAPLPPLPGESAPAQQSRPAPSTASSATARPAFLPPPLQAPSSVPHSSSTSSINLDRPPIPRKSSKRPPSAQRSRSAAPSPAPPAEPPAAKPKPDRAPVSSATATRPSTGTGSSAPSSSSSAPPKPLASVYLVAGLPKDPSHWSLASPLSSSPASGLDDPTERAEPECLPGSVGRAWRPEVLGVQVTAIGREDGGMGGIGREEVQRIQTKAMKLAFDRDVEIVAAPSQPAATASIFSFDVPSSPSFLSTSSTSASSTSSSANGQPTKTYHCVALLVWSLADAARSSAIRDSLVHAHTGGPGGAKARAAAVKAAAKATRVGKKLGERLERQLRSPMGLAPEGASGKAWASGTWSETEGETEPPFSESEWESTAPVSSVPLTPLSPTSSFWLPYSLILVSPLPLYDILSDALRLSWLRYHTDIAAHALQMERVLNTPVGRAGEQVRVPCMAEKQSETYFVTTVPGAVDWSTGAATVRHDLPLWPVFKALHADNLVTVAELALAPMGKVLFTSRSSLVLGLAVYAFQTILEARGWRGLVHPIIHVRDLRIYLDDPGPWLIGVPHLSLPLALSSLTPETVLVDLDNNAISCASPTPGAISTGVAREKARRRLEAAIGNVGGGFEVPDGLGEAFAGGRFRPFSMVEVAGEARDAERIKPEPSWDWNETRVLQAFDAVLKEMPQTGLARLFRGKRPRKVASLDSNALRIQTIVRKHSVQLVDRRDHFESKTQKTQQKLAFLLQESKEWAAVVRSFQEFSQKVTKESSDLKTRLEQERRKASRLSGQVLAEKERQAELEASLAELERAKEQALEELSSVDAVRQQLEQQRSLLWQEIETILASGEDETSPLFQSVYSRVESLSHRSDTPSATSSRPGTSLSVRSTSRLARQPSFLSDRRDSIVEENEEEYLNVNGHGLPAINEADEEVRLEAMKLAVAETFRSISSRLSLVLQTADHIYSPQSLTQSPTSVSPTTFRLSVDRPLSPSARPPPSPDVGPFTHSSLYSPASPSSPSSSFKPKPLTLTPPPAAIGLDSPPLTSDGPTPSASFVTIRPLHGRIPSTHSHNSGSPTTARRPNGQHRRQQSSLGSLFSFRSDESTSSAGSTPTAASVAHTVVRHAQLSRQASYGSNVEFQRAQQEQYASPSPRAVLHQRTDSSATAMSAGSTEYETDAQSFVSVSEGAASAFFTGHGSRATSRATQHFRDEEQQEEEKGAFELEELAWTVRQQEERMTAAVEEDFSPPLSGSHSRSASLASASNGHAHSHSHSREPSTEFDGPPVGLFTRTVSVRGKHGRRPSVVGSRSGSVDWRGRAMAPVGVAS
ncbi:hypothetical protein JCM8097_000754 [Rhodosporidiobolus ruineniae]